MPMIQADDGVRLYAESTGRGTPVLFIHEFAGDHRSWEPQVQHFSAAFRCVTYSARGYPPSEVPADPAAFESEGAGTVPAARAAPRTRRRPPPPTAAGPGAAWPGAGR